MQLSLSLLEVKERADAVAFNRSCGGVHFYVQRGERGSDEGDVPNRRVKLLEDEEAFHGRVLGIFLLLDVMSGCDGLGGSERDAAELELADAVFFLEDLL